MAGCIILYLENQNRTNYKSELWEKRKEFYNEKAFTLLSFDLSGIQQFIYTISSKGALKSLRARSFYLEILIENLADEILSICSLTRANLLYSGGGHAYLLLPNTLQVKQKIELCFQNVNRKLRQLFGTRLFLAYGFQECSANELMSKTFDPESYSNIFRSVAAQIAEKKLHRYSAAEIRELNSTNIDENGRECAICGASGNLKEYEEGVYCDICKNFIDISNMLIKEETVFVVAKEKRIYPVYHCFQQMGRTCFFYL